MNHESPKSIAADFGVKARVISDLAHRNSWASQRPGRVNNFNALAQNPGDSLSETAIAFCKSIMALAFPAGKIDEAAIRRLPPGLLNLCLRLMSSEKLQKSAEMPVPRIVGIVGLDLDRI